MTDKTAQDLVLDAYDALNAALAAVRAYRPSSTFRDVQASTVATLEGMTGVFDRAIGWNVDALEMDRRAQAADAERVQAIAEAVGKAAPGAAVTVQTLGKGFTAITLEPRR